jgi:integrase
MFAYAVSEGICATNPVAKIPFYAVPDKEPSILTIEQAERLIVAAAASNPTLGLLGYVTLGLFAGLRRAEIERLDWSAVKWERQMVTVNGTVAKTGSIRNVALAMNAIEWLRLCAPSFGPVGPCNISPRMQRLRLLAGIDKWEGNELRHSFASYHFDLHQNGPYTAAQLGHSSGCQLLFEHSIEVSFRLATGSGSSRLHLHS